MSCVQFKGSIWDSGGVRYVSIHIFCSIRIVIELFDPQDQDFPSLDLHLVSFCGGGVLGIYSFRSFTSLNSFSISLYSARVFFLLDMFSELSVNWILLRSFGNESFGYNFHKIGMTKVSLKGFWMWISIFQRILWPFRDQEEYTCLSHNLKIEKLWRDHEDKLLSQVGLHYQVGSDPLHDGWWCRQWWEQNRDCGFPVWIPIFLWSWFYQEIHL